MFGNRDPYAVLGVGPSATPAQISHAYRTLLRRHHPDTRSRNDDTAHNLALQEVLTAYAHLHSRARNTGEPCRSVRHTRQSAVVSAGPTVVLGDVGPTVTAPRWTDHDGIQSARLTMVGQLIACLRPTWLEES